MKEFKTLFAVRIKRNNRTLKELIQFGFLLACFGAICLVIWIVREVLVAALK